MVVNYTPLGGTFVDGQLIGSHGVQDKQANTFVYKAGINEVEFCAKHIFNDVLPKGRLWEAHGVIGTPDYSLSMAAGDILAQLLAYFEYLRKELDIDTTEDLITEWEESCGLPDPCTVQYFQTLEERRQQVKLRLKKDAVVMASQMELMVKTLTGFEVKIVPRRSNLNYLNGVFDGLSNFDAPEFGSNKFDRFTFDVFIDYAEDGSFNGEWLFDNGAMLDGRARPDVIKCVIERIKPSNSLAIYHFSKDLYQRAKDGV